MKKTLLSIIAIITFTVSSFAQNVNIPDVNFKAKLLANSNINTDADKLEISVAEAIAYNGEIDVSNSGINSLIGIESFINLTKLDCSDNQLDSLNVCNNIALNTLECSNNQLKSLDVTKNTDLNSLFCYNNRLSSLNVEKNTSLNDLFCNGNLLSSLDLTYNTSLNNFDCSNNQLKILDVTNNIFLFDLRCGGNQLTNLDISKNTKLSGFWCENNHLTNLDLSKNTELIDLFCFSNQLTSLNIKGNTSLIALYCSSNQLTSLDLMKNKSLTILECVDIPNLKCIQALDSQDKSSWLKDNAAQYTENCNYVTDINYDEESTQPKTISSIYNLQGQSVNNSYKGLVIIRYMDGTSEKVIQ